MFYFSAVMKREDLDISSGISLIFSRATTSFL